MADTLVNVDLTKVQIVRRTRYVTQALNRSNGLVSARGVIRGFRPVPSAVALKLELKVDAITTESIACIRGKATGDLEAILYKEEGDLTLDLTAYAGTSVYIALWKSYTVGSATDVEIRKYSAAEYAAGTTDEAVLLCGVAVPSSGAIPAVDIDQTVRDDSCLAEGEVFGEPLVPLIDYQFEDLSEAPGTKNNLRDYLASSGVTAAINAAASDRRAAGLRVSASGTGALQVFYPETHFLNADAVEMIGSIRFRPNAGLTWVTGLQVTVAFFSAAGGASVATDVETFTDTSPTNFLSKTWRVPIPPAAKSVRLFVTFGLSAGSVDLEELNLFVRRTRAVGDAFKADFAGGMTAKPIPTNRIAIFDGSIPTAAQGTSSAPFVMFANLSTGDDLNIQRPGGGDLVLGETANKVDLFVKGSSTFDDPIAVGGTPGTLSSKAYVAGEIVVTGPNIVLAGNNGNASFGGDVTIDGHTASAEKEILLGTTNRRTVVKYVRAKDIASQGSTNLFAAEYVRQALGATTEPVYTGAYAVGHGGSNAVYARYLNFTTTSVVTVSVMHTVPKHGQFYELSSNWSPTGINAGDAWAVAIYTLDLDAMTLSSSTVATGSGNFGAASASATKQVQLSFTALAAVAQTTTYLIEMTFTMTNITSRKLFSFRMKHYMNKLIGEQEWAGRW